MKYSCLLISLILTLGHLNCQPAQNIKTTIGPANGSLVIVGGAMKSGQIIDRFIELAGGLDAAIIVIPTASGRDSYDQNAGLSRRLKERGVTDVTVLHTNEKKIADSESFAKPLVDADGVWFGGGRQWRLVDAYQNTLTERLIRKVLERGGVIGGSSAGATIQGSFLARGDTQNNQIMMGDHQEGFGYLKNVAIDQHVLARNRQFDMYEILEKHPELLGIGIDEDTAIVVHGNQCEVIGESLVLMYDGSFWSREGSDLKNLPEKENLFYFLRDGDRYDLLKREVVR